MTGPTAFELTDAAIERMLVTRAGSGAPDELVARVVAAANATPQRSRSLLPPFAARGPVGHRALLAAAAVAVLVAVSFAAALMGGLFRTAPPAPTVPPPVITSPSPTTSASTTPTPTTSPAASPSAIATPAGASPLVVYRFADTFIDLFTLDPFTGTKQQLGNLQKTSNPMGQSIHWSADRKLAFVFADSDSLQALVDIDQETIETLPIGPSGGRDAVSPAGDLVARLDGDAEAGSVVVVLDLDGNEVHRIPLPVGLQPFLELAWSPDGSSVLVSGCLPCEDAGTAHHHLFIVLLDGGPIRQLGDNTTGYFGLARWSSDMTTIAYTNTDCGGDPCSGGIGIVRVGDGRVTPLTNSGDSGPVWSPDGRRIAFERLSGANKGIYIMDADGADLVRLTRSAGGRGDLAPLWSPDGAWIVFSRGESDKSLGDLYIVSSAGGEPRLLERNAVADW